MGGTRKQQGKEQQGKASKGSTIERLSKEEAVNAIVEEIVARTGARGEVTQINCKILAGRNEGKILRRNVKGPIKIGDLLTLRETEIEARRIRENRRLRST